jgi:hypothetical protein
MSQKIRKYFPNYRLGRFGDSTIRSREIVFIRMYEKIYFFAQTPLFGATKTQNAVLNWACLNTPPVVSIWHEPPNKPDLEQFRPDPHWLHMVYIPYAMTIATLDCLGEDTPRRIKVYFCDVQDWNPDTKKMRNTKTVYIAPVS